MQDRNEEIRDLIHSQSEGHPKDSHDRIVQEDRCTSGPVQIETIANRVPDACL